MPRKKKDGRFINYYIDRIIFERLERYAEDKGQPVTASLERILDDYLTRYEAEIVHTQRYCPICHLVVEDTRCPRCGRRWLEEPKPEDYCFLAEKDALWAGVLEDCLRRSGIAYLTQNVLGAGLTSKMGTMLETVKFYVRFSDYAQAQQLLEGLFSECAQILEEQV